MTTLLEFFTKYLDFLYLDPRYRITNSSTSGVATNDASLTLTGPETTWQIANDRGQILFSVAPTELANDPRNWFRLSIVRQYLDNYDETNTVPLPAAVAWIHDNTSRIDELFSDASAEESCRALTVLENANAEKYWGPPDA
jgi:hypothetical protein